jgi:DNA-binding PadR family transcriptional regulator
VSRREQILKILEEQPRDARAITVALGLKVTPGSIGTVRNALYRMEKDGQVKCLREVAEEPGCWVALR